MIKYAIMNQYDEDEFREFVMEFHEGEFMASQMEIYGLNHEYPSEYSEYHYKCESNANIIISEFIKEISEWINEHDEENPEVFFATRYETFLEELESYGAMIGDVLGKEVGWGPAFQSLTIYDIAEYLGSEKDFLDFWYKQTIGLSADQAWGEDRDYFRERIMDDNPEIEEDELELKVEEMIQNPDYESMMENVKEYISIMTTSNRDGYSKSPYRASDIEAHTFYSSGPIRKAMLAWWERIGMSELVDRWEERRSFDNGDSWVKDTTNFEQVVKAKEGLKRLVDSKNKSIKEKAVAITLALNLQHNAGNLLKDHLGINTRFLDELDELDTSEWQANIDEMIDRTGKTKEELYRDQEKRNKDEKYMRQRLDDMWMWKADRERFGRRQWYIRVKSANRVGRLNLGALRALKTLSLNH